MAGTAAAERASSVKFNSESEVRNRHEVNKNNEISPRKDFIMDKSSVKRSAQESSDELASKTKKNDVPKQKTLLDFTGFSTSKKSSDKTETDTKSTKAKALVCELCGDKIAHKGALKMHLFWHKSGKNNEHDSRKKPLPSGNDAEARDETIVQPNEENKEDGNNDCLDEEGKSR